MRRRGTFRRVAGSAAAMLVLGVVAGPADAAGTWTIQQIPNRGTDYNALSAVSARSATDVWAAGTFRDTSSNLYRTLIEHFDGRAWHTLPSPNAGGGAYNELNGISADSSTDAWAVGFHAPSSTSSTLAERWNGASWSIVATQNPAGSDTLRGVDALSPGNAWAVGDNRNPDPVPLIEHWNGSAWSAVPTPATFGTLASVSATGPNDVWAVGAAGNGDDGALVEHWNGAVWSIVPTPRLPGEGLLSAVTAIGPADVWAVGSSGSRTLTEHWNGSAWSIVSSPSPLSVYHGNNFLTGVTAVSATDVWAVGATLDFTAGELERTMTLHWNGTSWSVVSSPNRGSQSNMLLGVSSAGGGALFAAGTFSLSSVSRTLAMDTGQG
jgi:hypothetical protein